MVGQIWSATPRSPTNSGRLSAGPKQVEQVGPVGQDLADQPGPTMPRSGPLSFAAICLFPELFPALGLPPPRTPHLGAYRREGDLSNKGGSANWTWLSANLADILSARFGQHIVGHLALRLAWPLGLAFVPLAWGLHWMLTYGMYAGEENSIGGSLGV